MNLNEFSDYVCKNLLSVVEMGGDLQVRPVDVTKNNGIKRIGINICRKNQEICPTIYLEYFFDYYCSGKTMECTLKKIWKAFEESDNKLEVNMEEFYDFSGIKDKIILRLVNYELNKEQLEAYPYLPFHDLAITFRWLAKKDEGSIATAMVSKKDMERWKINMSQLYAVAKENTERLFPYKIGDMLSILKNLTDEENLDQLGELEKNENETLFVLTNEAGINGATSILLNGVLEECSKIAGGDIYILPSSIHEMIFFNSRMDSDVPFLKELVHSANESVVELTEVLSENIYFYDYNLKQLNII